jgi:hypothetical protein
MGAAATLRRIVLSSVSLRTDGQCELIRPE